MATVTLYCVNDNFIDTGYIRCSDTTYADALSGEGTFTFQVEAYYFGQRLNVGTYYVYESIVSFDTSIIGERYTLTSATLSAYANGNWDDVGIVLNARICDYSDFGTGFYSQPADYLTLGPSGEAVQKPLVATYDAGANGWPDESPSYVQFAPESSFLESINPNGYTIFSITSARSEAGTTPSGDEYLYANDFKLEIEIEENAESQWHHMPLYLNDVETSLYLWSLDVSNGSAVFEHASQSQPAPLYYASSFDESSAGVDIEDIAPPMPTGYESDEWFYHTPGFGADGTLSTFSYTSDDVFFFSSQDGGQTWSEGVEVATGFTDEYNLSTWMAPVHWFGSSGLSIAFYDATAGEQTWKFSYDGGETWPHQIGEVSNYVRASWMTDEDVFYFLDGTDGAGGLWRKRSSDSSFTEVWQWNDYFDSDPAVWINANASVTRGGGLLWVVSDFADGTYTIQESTDDGSTWSTIVDHDSGCMLFWYFALDPLGEYALFSYGAQNESGLYHVGTGLEAMGCGANYQLDAYAPYLSPDGTWCALTAASNSTAGDEGLWIYPYQGSLHPIVNNAPGYIEGPGGQTISFDGCDYTLLDGTDFGTVASSSTEVERAHREMNKLTASTYGRLRTINLPIRVRGASTEEAIQNAEVLQSVVASGEDWWLAMRPDGQSTTYSYHRIVRSPTFAIPYSRIVELPLGAEGTTSDPRYRLDVNVQLYAEPYVYDEEVTILNAQSVTTPDTVDLGALEGTLPAALDITVANASGITQAYITVSTMDKEYKEFIIADTAHSYSGVSAGSGGRATSGPGNALDIQTAGQWHWARWRQTDLAPGLYRVLGRVHEGHSGAKDTMRLGFRKDPDDPLWDPAPPGPYHRVQYPTTSVYGWSWLDLGEYEHVSPQGFSVWMYGVDDQLLDSVIFMPVDYGYAGWGPARSYYEVSTAPTTAATSFRVNPPYFYTGGQITRRSTVGSGLTAPVGVPLRLSVVAANDDATYVGDETYAVNVTVKYRPRYAAWVS